MCLVKPILSRYFRKFMVTAPSTEMTKGDMLLRFKIFKISRARFSNSSIFSASAVGRLLWVKGTAII